MSKKKEKEKVMPMAMGGVELDVGVWRQVLGVDNVEDMWIEWVEGDEEEYESWLLPIGGILRACMDKERLKGLGPFLAQWGWILRVLESRAWVVGSGCVEVAGAGMGRGGVADWPDWLVGLCRRVRSGNVATVLGDGILVMRVHWVACVGDGL